jgi:hypothetical protein
MLRRVVGVTVPDVSEDRVAFNFKRKQQLLNTSYITNGKRLMLYREIIAVCSEIHTKHMNTLWEQNVEFVNVRPGGT